MNKLHTNAIARLIHSLQKLPGIGPKSAERLAYHLLRDKDQQLVTQLAADLMLVKQQVRQCRNCHCLTEGELCRVCSDAKRDSALLCVVEDTVDLLAIDRTGHYRGLFHVLGGVLSPLDGRGPEKLNLSSLLARVRGGTIAEVLLATNADVEGEATAIYIQGLLREFPLKTTRLACGIPQGGNMSYLDQATLSRAINGRIDFHSNP